jgi:hypothetical protein
VSVLFVGEMRQALHCRTDCRRVALDRTTQSRRRIPYPRLRTGAVAHFFPVDADARVADRLECLIDRVIIGTSVQLKVDSGREPSKASFGRRSGGPSLRGLVLPSHHAVQMRNVTQADCAHIRFNTALTVRRTVLRQRRRSAPEAMTSALLRTPDLPLRSANRGDGPQAAVL